MSLSKEYQSTDIFKSKKPSVISVPMEFIKIRPNLEAKLCKWQRRRPKRSLYEPRLRQEIKPTTIVEFPSLDSNSAA